MLFFRGWEYGVFLGLTEWNLFSPFFLFFIDLLWFIVRILHLLSHGIIRLRQGTTWHRCPKAVWLLASSRHYFSCSRVLESVSYTCLLFSSTSQRTAYGSTFFSGSPFGTIGRFNILLSASISRYNSCIVMLFQGSLPRIIAFVSPAIILDSISLEMNDVDVFRLFTPGFERRYLFLCTFKLFSWVLRSFETRSHMVLTLLGSALVCQFMQGQKDGRRPAASLVCSSNNDFNSANII